MEINMIFKVQIILRKGHEIRAFYKEIGAANEEQAMKFANEMLEGFLADGISISTEIIKG